MKYGRFISANKSTLMIRVPGTRQENFHISLSDKAQARRDELCRQTKRSPCEPLNKSKRKHDKIYNSKTHRDLPVGITRIKKIYHHPGGGTSIYISICACVTGSNKKFATLKRGEDEAIKLAIEWRAKMLNQK